MIEHQTYMERNTSGARARLQPRCGGKMITIKDLRGLARKFFLIKRTFISNKG